MAASSKSPPKLKTKRERLIHNERRKLISNLCLGGAVAFLFVLAWKMRDWGATLLMRCGDLGGFIFLSITLVLIGLMSLSLFMVAWTTLDKMVDPDQDPKPDKPAPKPKPRKPRVSRSK